MKIYDITQELFGCCVYPGDPAPEREQLQSIARGDLYNLSRLSLCAHNGTHIDAPYHFLENGKTVDQIALEKCIGKAVVASCDGEPDPVWLEALLQNSPKKILFKGKTVVSMEAAQLMNRYGVELVGVESQTVGPEDAPMAVHLELLGRGVVLLEGIRLHEVPEGEYLLFAAPLCLGGADGAPCRAVLIETV